MLREIAAAGSSDSGAHFAAFAYSLEQLVTEHGFGFGRMLVLAGLTPVMCLLILATNILLMLAICRDKQLQKPFNLYILSLCVSDLLAVEWIVPYLIYYVTHDATLWNTNMHAFFLVAAFLNTMYTVLALSVHRFRGIVQPLKQGFTRRQTAATIAYIWGSVLVFTAIYAGIKYHCYPSVRDVDVNGTCPGVHVGVYNAFGFMHLLLIIFGYFIPILLSLLLNSVTAYKLKCVAAAGQSMVKSEQGVKAKTRAFKMVVVLFLLFVVLWTPYWGFMIYWHHTRLDPTLFYRKGSDTDKRANFLHNAAIFLALSYSWLNMFVYMYFGRDLRRAVWSVLTCARRRRGLATTSTGSTRAAAASRKGMERSNSSTTGNMHRNVTETSLAWSTGAGEGGEGGSTAAVPTAGSGPDIAGPVVVTLNI